MVQDLVYNLCESLVENIDGVAGIGKHTPTPITYLTQWKIVGNSEVHTLPYPDGVVLPTGYKRCEYLQSDGVAYIEVPFGFDKTDEVYAKVAMLDLSNERGFVAPKTWRSGNNRFCFSIKNNNAAFFFGASVYTLIPPITIDTGIYEWEYKTYIVSVGVSSYNLEEETFEDTTPNLRLFFGYAINNSATQCKIYEYRHKKANAEYRLIPCLDSNDTPCMYDVINNQAYYNSASSGSFTYKLYPQPTEIWSCGEYNPIDGKWHILVQPLGGSIADIALTEPLRKVNDVADTIEFPSDTEGKVLVTRNLASVLIGNVYNIQLVSTNTTNVKRMGLYSIPAKSVINNSTIPNILCSIFEANSANNTYRCQKGIAVDTNGKVQIYDPNYNTVSDINDFKTAYAKTEIIYELKTPTTELVDVPQIAEAESYTMVISQGGKAVSWSSFETE